jgi:MFS family permease
MRDKPQDMGLFPDGVSSKEEIVLPKASAVGHESWTRRAAIGTMAFWIIAMAFGLQSFGNTGVAQNQARHLRTVFVEGTPVYDSIDRYLMVVAFGSTAGKLFFGWLADRIGPRLTSISCISCSLVAISVMISITDTSATSMIWVYGIFIGLSMGGWASNTPMLIANYYGLKYYGSIYGAANMLIMMGTAFGPMVAGAVYDAQGTYRNVFIYALCLSVVAIISLSLMRVPKPKNTTT